MALATVKETVQIALEKTHFHPESQVWKKKKKKNCLKMPETIK